jgi:hypothetical protein
MKIGDHDRYAQIQPIIQVCLDDSFYFSIPIFYPDGTFLDLNLS